MKKSTEEALGPVNITRNILWNSIGSFSYLFLQWIITVLVARLLGFDGAGIFSLAMSTSNIFICIALYGVRNFQVSDVSNQYSDLNYMTFRIITCITSVIMCLIYVVIQHYTWIQSLCIVIYMIYRAFEAFVDVLHGIDQKIWRMDIVGKSFVFRGIAMFFAALVVMIYVKNIIIMILLMTVVTTLIIMIFDIRITRKFIKPSDQPRSVIITLLKDCSPLALYWLMSNTIVAIPRLFLEHIKGSEILGIYASISTPAVLIQVLSTYIFSPFIGLFAQHLIENNKQKFTKLLFKITVILMIISFVSIAVAQIFGKFGLEILFGSKILPYAYLLFPIILTAILTAISWFLCMIITVIREIKELLISNLIGFVLVVSITTLFIHKYGINGTSYSIILSYTVQIIFLLIFIFLFIGRKWKTNSPESMRSRG